MIQFRLVQDYASKNGITVSEDQVQKAIDGFEAQVGKDTLAALLTTNNVTHDDFTQLVRLSLLENEVATHLGKVGVGQLRTAYRQNIEQYATITADHILVKTKAEADSVYQQVTRPGATRADFLKLAKEVSIDPSAAQNSGELPATAATKFPKSFALAALALKPGQISRPVQTQFGWHVIHLVDKQITPFAQVRDSGAEAGAGERLQRLGPSAGSGGGDRRGSELRPVRPLHAPGRADHQHGPECDHLAHIGLGRLAVVMTGDQADHIPVGPVPSSRGGRGSSIW